MDASSEEHSPSRECFNSRDDLVMTKLRYHKGAPLYFNLFVYAYNYPKFVCVQEVGTVNNISDYQLRVLGFNHWVED